MPAVPEEFTDAEREVLARHFTNVDGPVFALVGLPEVTKGALFARYSRSPKSLRRLFLDEFADAADTAASGGAVGAARAEGLYDRVLAGFGDDSVAQLGAVHLACEDASNVLTKILERGRLASYLEQSTRYIPYDSPVGGRFRYLADPGFGPGPLLDRWTADMDATFAGYGTLLRSMTDFVARRFPREPDEPEPAWTRAVRARALDVVRGVLPAATLSNVGIFASGQSYEALLLRMEANPLPEVREYAAMMLGELRKVIPAFLSRVDRPDRGLAHSAYLAGTRAATAAVAARLFPREPESPAAPGVTLVDWDPAGEEKVLAAAAASAWPGGLAEIRRAVSAMGDADRGALMAAYVGERTNRRHRPGRAFEQAVYTFEVVSDYGVFRDLQRHRILTIDWQPLSTSLGWDEPDLVGEAGMSGLFAEQVERCAALHDAVRAEHPVLAVYAVPFVYRVRYHLTLNAREAMHLCELRSAPGGHPAYRAAAAEMHRQIREVAGHRLVADAMRFVDYGDAGLGRREAEARQEARRPGR